MTSYKVALILILSFFITPHVGALEYTQGIFPHQSSDSIITDPNDVNKDIDELNFPSNEIIEEYNSFLKTGDLYLTEKHYGKARENYKKALSIITNYDANELLLQYYLRYAKLDYLEEKPTSAITNLRKGLIIANKMELTLSVATIYTQLSYIFYDNFDYASAEAYLNEASAIYKKEKQINDYAKSAYNLSIVYKKLDNIADEKYFYDEYTRYRSHIKTSFYMFSENIGNTPYYIDLNRNFINHKFYETNFITLKVLNKITAKTFDFRILVGSKLKFHTIEIRPHACWKSQPEEIPDNKALLSVYELKEDESTKVYNGWFLSSSPSISTFEHPFYDIILESCIGRE